MKLTTLVKRLFWSLELQFKKSRCIITLPVCRIRNRFSSMEGLAEIIQMHRTQDFLNLELAFKCGIWGLLRYEKIAETQDLAAI